MMRIKGRYRNKVFELEQPLDLAEGTEVELAIRPITADQDRNEDEAWQDLGMSRLEAEWDNPQDAVYDDWKKLYGIQSR